ncbi:MAG TPA: response regulator transcription factor [Solirubrobacteraceae bacterium]|jgi:DNA-binding NarL/FixJ family response regulator|nr:response regulator transcription factor [Solirubrobacteraceae bacterium]
MPSVLPDSSHPRLMIADDDPVVRSMLNISLSQAFDVVGIAADGEQAVEFAKASQPDVALVDVEMPRGGGLRAVQGIHEVAPNTAIVLLSIDESDGIVRELMQAGATTYLRKGVGPHALADALMASIEAHAVECGRPAG